MTTNPPHERAEQLASTGVPGFFELVYCVHTVNARVAETIVHEALAEHRSGELMSGLRLDRAAR